MPSQLLTLLDEARANVKKGMPQHKAIHHLCEILWVNGIRVHMDMSKPPVAEVAKPLDAEVVPETPAEESGSAEEISEDLKSVKLSGNQRSGKKTIVPFQLVRNYDGSYKMALDDKKKDNIVMTSANPNVPPLVLSSDNPILRIILCDNKSQKKSTAFWNECLGVIIDTIKWKIISVPSNSLLNHPNRGIVNSRLRTQDYEIIPIIDGTMLTLYNWDHADLGNIWSLASRNGYDVSTLKWSGPKTYSEIVMELFARLYPEFVQQTGMTINANKLLAFENLDKNFCYTFLFRHHDFQPLIADPEGIWQVQSVNLKTLDKSHGCLGPNGPPQQPSIPSNENMKLDDFKQDESGYGFLLHCKKGPGPDILIESKRLREIKKLVYNVHNNNVEPEERNDYVAFRAYLNGSPNRENFTKYYPEWIMRYKKINDFIASTTTKVIEHLKSADPKPATSLVLKVSEDIEKCVGIPSIKEMGSDAETIVRDMVTNSEYALLMLREIPN